MTIAALTEAFEQARAADRAVHIGPPTRRQEGWRWTDLAKLDALEFQPRESAFDRAIEIDGADRVVIVDGHVAPSALAAPSQMELRQRSHGKAAEGTGALAELNAALSLTGVDLTIAPGASPIIHFDHRASGQQAVARCRHRVRLEAQSSAILVETFSGPDETAYWDHVGCDISIGPEARLIHVRLESAGRGAIHTGDLHVRLEAGAHYEQVALSLGARLHRLDLVLEHVGPGTRALLAAGYLALGARHVDFTSAIHHSAAGCQSDQLVKGVVSDQGRGVFQGRIIVHPDAQKTDARQLTKGLILTPGAEIDHKPELEIHADDVACAHGATCADIDDQALFYLLSRGIDEASARRLLIGAHVNEVVERLADGPVRQLAQAALDKVLEGWS